MFYLYGKASDTQIVCGFQEVVVSELWDGYPALTDGQGATTPAVASP